MEQLPLIDIAEPDRIAALTAAPDTFSFRADAAENLDGLVPDIGLTGKYPYRSVYRPRSFARAGLPATLTHRFWDTLDGSADHTGRRWIGVVMYDEHGSDCRLEITLGADPIGCMVPFRHDNRRHLYVLDRPVQFMGEMEVLRISGTGDAGYRLEHVVLLKERPAATSHQPRIERLTARLRRRPDGAFVVAVDAISRPAARCSVTLLHGATGAVVGSAQGDEHLSLHAVELEPAPAPAAGYRARIVATEAGGRQETAEVAVAGRPDAAAATLSIPMEITNLAGAALAGLPATFGLPVPPGHLFGPTTGRWEMGDAAAPVQCRPHGFRSDGSASWVLVDGCPPAALEPGAGSAGTVVLSPASPASPPPDGLRCSVDDHTVSVAGEGFRVRMTAGDGPPLPVFETRTAAGGWRPVQGGSSATLTLGDGQELRQGPIHDLVLEESGWQRAVVRYRFAHLDADGTAHLRSTIRIHVYRGRQALRIVHRLEVNSPHLPPAVGGTAAAIPEHDRTIRRSIAGSDGEQATVLTVRSATLGIGRTNGAVYWPGGAPEGTPVAEGSHLRLIHDHDQGHRVEHGDLVREVARRVPGQVTVTDGAPGHDGAPLSVALRRFWQTYPRAIRVSGDAIVVELLPPPAPGTSPRPGDAESWHRIYFWLGEQGYLLKAGMALSSEILVAWGPRDEALLAWFEEPPAVRPALEWLNACNALAPLAAKDTGVLDRYERALDGGYEQWIADREIRRQYGWLNFGDWYGESAWSWGNNEYDPPFAHYCEFLRGGDPRWFILGAEAARHLTDVDTVNFSTDPTQVGAQYTHMPGHAGGYLPPYFRSKMGGSSSVPSHTWVEGSVLHYLLTGDESLRESLDRTAQWLLVGGLQDYAGGIQHYDFANCRECGWHLIHLTALARMSTTPRYLNAAALIVERVLERQEPGGGWERVLKEGHCGCEPPRERGEAGFMVGVLLSGLRRYHELTGDERVRDAILGGIDWLLRRTYDAASGHFRYTPCLHRGGGPQPGYTSQVIEGLAYAHALTGRSDLRDLVQRGLGDVGALPQASPEPDHSGFGKDWASQTRYVPSLLAYLTRRPD